MLDLRQYQDDTPRFTDANGQEHMGARLSVVEEFALEKLYGDFLGDVLAGRVNTDEEFTERALPVVEGTGYPVELVMKLPAEAFWDVLNDFFRPRKKRGTPEAATPEPGTGTPATRSDSA